MTQRKGFTLIELLVVISIIALLIGILLPALGAARRSARQMQSNTQVRGIHQGMVIYAQANKTGTSDGQFPGLAPNGDLVSFATTLSDQLMNDYVGNTFSQHGQDIGHRGTSHGGTDAAVSNDYSGTHVGGRVAIMLSQNLFSPEYAVNPLETSYEGQDGVGRAFEIVPWEPGEHYFDSASHRIAGSDELEEDDRVVGSHSYAMLAISESHNDTDWVDRKLEWAETLSSRSIVISDRLLGSNPNQNYHSHLTRPGSGQWRGSVGWNDGHVGTENRLDGFTTEYGGQVNEDDNLFDQSIPSGADDAGATACLFHHARSGVTNSYNRQGSDENCF